LRDVDVLFRSRLERRRFLDVNGGHQVRPEIIMTTLSLQTSVRCLVPPNFPRKSASVLPPYPPASTTPPKSRLPLAVTWPWRRAPRTSISDTDHGPIPTFRTILIMLYQPNCPRIGTILAHPIHNDYDSPPRTPRPAAVQTANSGSFRTAIGRPGMRKRSSRRFIALGANQPEIARSW